MRKNSKSLRRSSSKKQSKKKECLIKYAKKEIGPLNIQDSLYRKYPSTQNYHYICGVNTALKEEKPIYLTKQEMTEECLDKYYKSINRKNVFSKIKEVYKLHREIPLIAQPELKQVLNKCYHRKRVLDYFKVAKVLGIKIDSTKFSTFLLTLIDDITNNKMQSQKHYNPIITQISTIDFSTEVERKLLEEFLNHEKQSVSFNKENWASALNSQIFG